MASYKLTWLGLFLASGLYLFGVLTGMDLFEQLVALTQRVEPLEVDELIIPLLVLLCFAIADLLRRRHLRRLEVEREKLKVYKAMLHAVHHILNNFLNQMLIFKITAKKRAEFNKDILAMYDQVIEEAEKKIGDLGTLETVDEKSIRESVNRQ